MKEEMNNAFENYKFSILTEFLLKNKTKSTLLFIWNHPSYEGRNV
jgi:hypothetical protein